MKLNNKLFFSICYLVFVFIFLYLLFFLAISVETFKGILFVISSFFILFFPIFIIYKFYFNKYFLLLTCLILIIFVSIGFQKNQGESNNFKLECLNKCSVYNWNPINAISERELLDFGFKVSDILSIGKNKVELFSKNIIDIENKININLPSQIPDALVNKTSPEKYFVYEPKISNNKVLFVLHGSAGSFLYYQKLFKEFSDETGTILISPIYGWGNWSDSKSLELINNIYIKLQNDGLININTEVNMLGISNGGRGLTRVISSANSDKYSKYFFISGVYEENILKNNIDINYNNIYIVHGKNDLLVPYLSNDKIKSENKLIYEKGDHFILANEFKGINSFIKKSLAK